MIVLRPYQQDQINKIRASFAKGNRAVLSVAPTGSGKTLMFSYMTKAASEKGNRTLIIVHRQELLMQASRSLASYGVEHGMIAPGRHGETAQVAVASVQTLDRRLKRGSLDFDFLILDEAHHAVASTWSRVLAHFPRAKILGKTATPCRLDGRGLGVSAGGIFDDLVVGPSIAELIAGGYLVKPVVYAPPTDIDLSGVRRRGGDYVASDVASRIDKPTITGSAVEHYARLAPGEPAIAFCASIEHAEHVTREFRAAGFSSEVIHGGLGDAERRQMIEGLASGRIQVLTSVDLISEGTDIPVVSVGILLRPTQSLSLYIQQVGRILRTSPSKQRALLLDHTNLVLRHGLPDDEREWSLDGVAKKSKPKDDDETSIRQCKKCFAVYERGLKCPYCGNINIAEARKPKTVDGELKEIDREELERLRRSKRQQVGRAQTREELEAIARERGYASGWVYMMMNARKRR